MERVDKIQQGVDGVVSQLDTDRKDIDQLRVKMGEIASQQEQLLGNMDSFRQSVRNDIESSVKFHVERSIKRNLAIQMLDRKRVFIVYKSFWEGVLGRIKLVINWFKKHD